MLIFVLEFCGFACFLDVGCKQSELLVKGYLPKSTCLLASGLENILLFPSFARLSSTEGMG